MKAYLIEYLSDSGVELTAFNAENIEEAKEKFWSTRDTELNQIFLIIESDVVNYEGNSGTDSCCEDCPENPSGIVPYGFVNKVFASRCDVECFPVGDGFYFSGSKNCDSISKRMLGRVKDFFGRFFWKFN